MELDIAYRYLSNNRRALLGGYVCEYIVRSYWCRHNLNVVASTVYLGHFIVAHSSELGLQRHLESNYEMFNDLL
jgi:hypothetical protein